MAHFHLKMDHHFGGKKEYAVHLFHQRYLVCQQVAPFWQNVQAGSDNFGGWNEDERGLQSWVKMDCLSHCSPLHNTAPCQAGRLHLQPFPGGVGSNSTLIVAKGNGVGVLDTETRWSVGRIQ